MSADQAYKKNISKWYQHFQTKPGPDEEMKKLLTRFLPRTVDFISSVYKNQEQKWAHAHFKPQEIYQVNPDRYYLTDFAHVKMLPEAHELAFIIWADQIMTQPVYIEYSEWREGIRGWQKLMVSLCKQRGIDEAQFTASLAERTLGTLLMDYGSSDKPQAEINAMFEKGMRLLQDLIS